jgi:2-amino-4-hydroxy-6-hydroxymethyldihydropteridine diphosphokinase
MALQNDAVSVFIAFGSNLGDRSAAIDAAATKLASSPGLTIKARSSVYETEPVSDIPQGLFLNGVFHLQCRLPALDLMNALLRIEDQLGRVRQQATGPRIIDLDLLFYGDLICNDKLLTLPHPRLHERAFVLRPLYDLAPDLVHPILGQSIRQLWTQMKKTRA